MPFIRQFLYIIMLLSAGGIFGFFLAERALLSNMILAEEVGEIDLMPLIEATLKSSQFAFVIVGMTVATILQVFVSWMSGNWSGRWFLLLTILSFIGVAATTYYLDGQSPNPPFLSDTFLSYMRITLSALALIFIAYAMRATPERRR